MRDVNYGKREHIIVAEYRYVFPVIDATDESQRILIDILNTKTPDSDAGNYCYKVEERNLSMVFPATLEAAVRDGDVKDIMLAKDSDQIMFKTKHGKSVLLDFHDANDDMHNLYEGEGPNEDVLMKRVREEMAKSKRHKRNTKNLSSITSIFESKEKKEEQRLEKETQMKAATRQKIQEEREIAQKLKTQFNTCDFENFKQFDTLLANTDDLHDLVKPVIESWDGDTYEKEVHDFYQNEIKMKVNKLPQPCGLKPIIINESPAHVPQEMLHNTCGLDFVSCVGNLQFPDTPGIENIKLIEKLGETELMKLENILMKLSAEDADVFPNLEEILFVTQNITKGSYCEKARVPGVQLKVNGRDVFIPGERVIEANEITFVPGQTVITSDGKLDYQPGYLVETSNGKAFLPGQITGTNETANFVAGQIVGSEFVAGQTIVINNEPRFIQGQTVITPEGVKFVAGVMNPEEKQFVPGQFMKSSGDSFKFVAGQTITTEGGEKFIAGQCNYTKEEGWNFVMGQTITTEMGESKFVAGKTLNTTEGNKFVAGQYVDDVFVAGITKELPDGTLQFTTGMNIDTKQGCKFVEGQMISTKHGEIFLPGVTQVTEAGEVDFKISRTLNEIAFSESVQAVQPIDSESFEITDPSLSVFGHMVQTRKGVEFYPSKIDKLNLPEGKLIPGKLIKQKDFTKFVPGIVGEQGFIPGQVVLTAHGEQFVPGQVIETVDKGLKFVPGQVIETADKGSKFVPGQVIGDRFVPGQVIETKSGPTFIPGQVIYIENEGERFVPGEVIETEENGPQFVPGRIVEENDRVTFIPGQIVQTAQGPRYVAPDLKGNEEGEFEFLVQSFSVTPEELNLLKSTHTWNTTSKLGGELTIDMKMLRQLSEAGMTIGRQVEAPAIDIVLQSTLDDETVQKYIAKLGLDAPRGEAVEEIFSNIKRIVQNLKGQNEDFISTNLSLNSQIKDNSELNENMTQIINFLASTLICVMTTDKLNSEQTKNKIQTFNNSSLYEVIASTLDASFQNIELHEINQLMNAGENKELMTNILNENITKIKMLSELAVLQKQMQRENSPISEEQLLEKICNFIDDTGVVNAFKHMVEKNPALIKMVLQDVVSTKIDVTHANHHLSEEIVHKAVVSCVKQKSAADLVEMLTANAKSEDIVKFLTQAAGLAQALDLSEEASGIQKLINNEITIEQLLKDESVHDVLTRLTIMNNLAEGNPELQETLQQLQSLPASQMRNNEKLRNLLRESGTLIYEPEQKLTLQTSNDIPFALLSSDNLLAMEEFLMRTHTKNPGAFLILLNGIQAIVPSEKSHDVLTGKCAYTVLDENGIRYFEPLHVLSALQLNSPTDNRFSIYNCAVVEDDVESVKTSTSSSNQTSDCNISIPKAAGTTDLINNRRKQHLMNGSACGLKSDKIKVYRQYEQTDNNINMYFHYIYHNFKK